MSLNNPAMYIVTVYDDPAPLNDDVVRAVGKICKNCSVGRITPVKR